MNRKLKMTSLVSFTALVFIVVFLLVTKLRGFNERPVFSSIILSATLISSVLAEPCSWNTTLRGSTQGDFYEYTAQKSKDQVTQFYEKLGAKCEKSTNSENDIVCRKDDGNSVSYSIYIKDLPNEITQSSKLTIEVRWAC